MTYSSGSAFCSISHDDTHTVAFYIPISVDVQPAAESRDARGPEANQKQQRRADETAQPEAEHDLQNKKLKVTFAICHGQR